MVDDLTVAERKVRLHVEQIEDGVARLVDGEDDHLLVFSSTQPAGGGRRG